MDNDKRIKAQAAWQELSGAIEWVEYERDELAGAIESVLEHYRELHTLMEELGVITEEVANA